MTATESPQERARRAQLVPSPHNDEACGACIYYADRTDAEGYCAHKELLLNVATSWWCSYYDPNRSNAKFGGHPLHPALIPFPLALTSMALAFDILAEVTRRSEWRREANHALIAGTITGLIAAPVGTLDWASLPTRRPAKTYGLVHGLGNLLLLAMNGVNISLRNRRTPPSAARRASEIGLSVLANILAFGTGWLGGELTYRLSVGQELPRRPYRVLEIEPIVRLSDDIEWKDGQLRIPGESLWSGPAVPSEPLPAKPEEPRAAS